MIIHVMAILLILGIAYLQMTQGLFSSLIMAVCTVFSAGLAIILYEPLATTMYNVQPAIADGVSLALLFATSLFVLRYLADQFINKDILFDMYVDRVGGAIFGLLSGTFIIGVLLVVMQLLPFGRVVMGDYRPYNDSLLREKRLAPFFPDDCVVGFGKIISAGSMSGAQSLVQVHDDLLLEAFCTRNTANRHGRVDTEINALRFLGAYQYPDDARNINWEDLDKAPPNPLVPEEIPTKVLIVRVSVNVSATGDKNDWWRLPGTQFRLHCKEKKTYHSYYPIGYLYYDTKTNGWRSALPPESDNVIKPAQLIVMRPKDVAGYEDASGEGRIAAKDLNLVVDWVYRIPADAVPQTIYFRRVDGAKVKAVQEGFPQRELRGKALKSIPPKSERTWERRGRRRR